MQRLLVILLAFFLSLSGEALVEANATDAVNSIFAEFQAETAQPSTTPPLIVAPIAGAPIAAEPEKATDSNSNAEQSSADATLFERNSSAGKAGASSWINVSARVLFPKLIVGINPNISNGLINIKFQENTGAGVVPHTANINVSSITQNGYIDLIGFSGMEQQFSASPEVDITLWDWLTLSWTQLKGSGAATTPLSVSVDGAANVTIIATAQTDLTMDLIGVQFLDWGFLKSEYIDLNLLAGVQLFWPEKFTYNYSLPIPNMTQTVWQGSGGAPFPFGTPYYGLGADIKLGDFTVSGSYSGLAGLEALIANYTAVDLNYYILNVDVNYAFNKSLSLDAGYRLFNLQPTLQNGFTKKWMSDKNLEGNVIDGYSTLLRAEGPYGGITVRF